MRTSWARLGRWACVAAVAFGAGLGTAQGQSTQPVRGPNILFIMTDQHAQHVLGCAGNPLVKTPNLDRLAAEGIRFTHATCVTPFCSPTRASLWTGRWPHSHGITYNVAPDGAKPGRRAGARRGEGLSDEYVVLQNVLSENGYQVGYFGKWHLGDLGNLKCFRDMPQDQKDLQRAYVRWLESQPDAIPTREPRDGEVFVEADHGAFVRKTLLKNGPEDQPDQPRGDVGKRASRSAQKAGGTPTPQNNRKADGTPALQDKETQESKAIGRAAVKASAEFEAWLTDRAIEWLKHRNDKPFMLTISYGPPHAPWIVPDPYYSMYDPAAMLMPASLADRPAAYRQAQASKLFDLWGEAGLREQLRCYYGMVSMIDDQVGRVLELIKQMGLERDTLVVFTSDHGDMQGGHGMMGKSVHAFYDGTVRVPLIVRYPGVVTPGRTTDATASSVDLMPTLLESAGIPVPPSVQGRSLMPALTGSGKLEDAPAFCERGIADANTGRMIRTKEWKYCLYAGDREELFDLKNDPDEMKNLAAEAAHGSTREQLRDRLFTWMRKTQDAAIERFSANKQK